MSPQKIELIKRDGDRVLILGKPLNMHRFSDDEKRQLFEALDGLNGETFADPVASLLAGATTFNQRNAIYGDNYLRFGQFMQALFPSGLTLQSVDDWNALGVFVQVVSKVTRFAEGWKQPENENTGDSAHDLMVYAAMLHQCNALRASNGKGE